MHLLFRVNVNKKELLLLRSSVKQNNFLVNNTMFKFVLNADIFAFGSNVLFNNSDQDFLLQRNQFLIEKCQQEQSHINFVIDGKSKKITKTN
jgi:hypothetical protein